MKKELTFIIGFSGNGKTRLMNQLIKKQKYVGVEPFNRLPLNEEYFFENNYYKEIERKLNLFSIKKIKGIKRIINNENFKKNNYFERNLRILNFLFKKKKLIIDNKFHIINFEFLLRKKCKFIIIIAPFQILIKKQKNNLQRIMYFYLWFKYYFILIRSIKKNKFQYVNYKNMNKTKNNLISIVKFKNDKIKKNKIIYEKLYNPITQFFSNGQFPYYFYILNILGLIFIDLFLYISRKDAWFLFLKEKYFIKKQLKNYEK